MKLEAEFWVAVAFLIFVGVLGYFGVHKLLVKGIDDRRDRIKAELDEALRLKTEAQALLAQYQRKQQEAEPGDRHCAAELAVQGNRDRHSIARFVHHGVMRSIAAFARNWGHPKPSPPWRTSWHASSTACSASAPSTTTRAWNTTSANTVRPK